MDMVKHTVEGRDSFDIFGDGFQPIDTSAN